MLPAIELPGEEKDLIATDTAKNVVTEEGGFSESSTPASGWRAESKTAVRLRKPDRVSARIMPVSAGLRHG
ncbi:hypothetical protein DSJ_18430 [Pantoea stewartii subsp. stewartii DC283]|uniref:Uncharacterized protein n=1 Tax=Pantoea stewartii subsp. stewartii DC283 TaxID=660596 RepID=A0ABM6K8B5_PANSE|nr:hypothetical protein DSJ_18430 [Pantoea stewartii subsp. stewartii DC283]